MIPSDHSTQLPHLTWLSSGLGVVHQRRHRLLWAQFLPWKRRDYCVLRKERYIPATTSSYIAAYFHHLSWSYIHVDMNGVCVAYSDNVTMFGAISIC